MVRIVFNAVTQHLGDLGSGRYRALSGLDAMVLAILSPAHMAAQEGQTRAAWAATKAGCTPTQQRRRAERRRGEAQCVVIVTHPDWLSRFWRFYPQGT